MIPWRKVAVSAIFCEKMIFKRQIIGNGRISIPMPVITLGMAMKRANCTLSIHRPCVVLSQLYAMGVHLKDRATDYNKARSTDKRSDDPDGCSKSSRSRGENSYIER